MFTMRSPGKPKDVVTVQPVPFARQILTVEISIIFKIFFYVYILVAIG